MKARKTKTMPKVKKRRAAGAGRPPAPRRHKIVITNDSGDPNPISLQ